LKYSLKDIAAHVGGEVRGDESLMIEGLATLKSAGPLQISFLANAAYQDDLKTTNAGAVLVAESAAADAPCAAIVVPNAYLAFALTTELFDRTPQPKVGIHPSANVASSAILGENVSIDAGVSIGEGVVIGSHTTIGANSVIGDNVKLGESCTIAPLVSIYHGSVLADRVRIHSGSVIGADGFGFAPVDNGWLRIRQLGGVVIGHDVDIGANTTIDRGALDDTIIGDYVIIDNLVQIAHNVKIGSGTAIAGCTGIAGSSTIGKNCTLAGGVGVVGHIEICDGVHVTGMTMVTKSITQPGAYSSGTPMSDTKTWKRNAVRFNQLNDLAKTVKKLSS